MADGIILLDKAPGWTSHDVVAKCRGLLRERRCGHGGTLDPMATGLLVVFLGRATRAAQYLPGNKTYRAVFRFGEETDSLDVTGTVTKKHEKIPKLDELVNILPSFKGEISQIPPMVSAVKVDGERLYKLARQGLEVERAARTVTIWELEAYTLRSGEYGLYVTCSAGTYIRTLISDIGHALGSGAVMTGLRREASGPFRVEDAVTVDNASPDRIMPVDRLFMEYPAVCVPEGHLKAVLNGGGFPYNTAEDGQFYRVYDESNKFLMLGRGQNGLILTEKSFFEV